MAVSASATLTSSGSLTAPKSGDVLTMTYTITGDTVTGQVTSAGTVSIEGGAPIPVTFSPQTLSYVEPESISGPVVTGLPPFVQSATQPHVWTVTLP